MSGGRPSPTLAQGSPSRGPFVGGSGGERRLDWSRLDEAASYWRRGERAMALHFLEGALPADFAGLAQLAPENRP